MEGHGFLFIFTMTSRGEMLQCLEVFQNPQGCWVMCRARKEEQSAEVGVEQVAKAGWQRVPVSCTYEMFFLQ